MFKIRTASINDITELCYHLKDNTHLAFLNKTMFRKFISSIQFLIPPNFRSLPSIYIAVEEENIIGFIILRCASRPNNCWQIEEVFVFDEVRNSGVGEELVRYVLSLYGSYGIEHFLAEVDSENFPALSLFHQCGFRRYAKVYFYEKEINSSSLTNESLLLDKDFILRPCTLSDLTELEKLDLSTIPPDLRPALGRSKDFFYSKKNSFVLIDKSRNLIIGWTNIQKHSNGYFIELLISPGWTHLYDQFLNTIVCNHTVGQEKNFVLTIKVIDYITELTEILSKSGFLPTKVKELLVRTIWQKVKEKQKKTARIGVPYTAPT